jgi:cold shock CspA family protein
MPGVSVAQFNILMDVTDLAKQVEIMGKLADGYTKVIDSASGPVKIRTRDEKELFVRISNCLHSINDALDQGQTVVIRRLNTV